MRGAVDRRWPVHQDVEEDFCVLLANKQTIAPGAIRAHVLAHGREHLNNSWDRWRAENFPRAFANDLPHETDKLCRDHSCFCDVDVVLLQLIPTAHFTICIRFVLLCSMANVCKLCFRITIHDGRQNCHKG